MSQKFEKLKKILKELFQLDHPDLDFGLYRIMHAKAAEVTAFLEKDLLPQVKAEFGQYKTADKAELQKELDKVVAGLIAAEVDPETSPKVKELRAKLTNEAVDVASLENDVYDHLLSFFSRYYSEGDFVSKRRYSKDGKYAIPYDGEEVKLYWANHDQYYIKTSEYLRDYAFRLRADDDAKPMRVHFRLADVAEGEHGNVKAAAGKDRVFILAATNPVFQEVDELICRFEYRPATLTDWPDDVRSGKTKPPAQKDLTAIAEARILAAEGKDLTPWLAELAKPHVKADGEKADYNRLRAHLNRYFGRNTFDYFIHKNIGGFLRRELDFYIKNEVMMLDDIENESAPRVEQYLSKIKVIRRIAGKIITFLAQLEDFQRALWLKKKFVVETQYCVAIKEIPEEFLPEIVANAAQWAEWESLHHLPELTNENDSLFTKKVTLKSPEFLKETPSLMIDTRHFDADFTARLLDALGDLDTKTRGVLFHSENFQALSLMHARYKQKVKCIYIDPPYNTGDSEILYKNEYLRSSWLSLMDNRLEIAHELLDNDSALFIAIDDFEMANLSELIDNEYRELRREMIIVNHHPQGGKAKILAHTHEYMLACIPHAADRTLVGRMGDGETELRPFKRSGTAESNFRYGRPNSFYAILVDPQTRNVIGLEPPPTPGKPYPTNPTPDGKIRCYPLGAQGDERVWRRSYESCLTLIANKKLVCTEGMTIYQSIEPHERTAALFSNWVDPRYNAGTFGANLLRDVMGQQNPFAYPKSIHTVGDAVFSCELEAGDIVLDYFAGSGTTGHAVIALNREDDQQRRFILVETGNHFDTVIVPRLKKVSFTPDWKDGKPQRLPTTEEIERGPGIMKIIRLESYEDVLNNLEVRRSTTQQSLLEHAEAQGPGKLREQYLLKYMLRVESSGSPSLLNVKSFSDPTGYRLVVKSPGSDESREICVDLIETFNWLIGLYVHHIARPQSFSAQFERDAENRLRIKGRLQPDKSGSYWFRTVTGTMPDGRNTLIIWRKQTGNTEQDNIVLDAWFTKQGYSSKDSEFAFIFVNGGNNLENLKTPEDTWKVRLIESEFNRLMCVNSDA